MRERKGTASRDAFLCGAFSFLCGCVTWSSTMDTFVLLDVSAAYTQTRPWSREMTCSCLCYSTVCLS